MFQLIETGLFLRLWRPFACGRRPSSRRWSYGRRRPRPWSLPWFNCTLEKSGHIQPPMTFLQSCGLTSCSSIFSTQSSIGGRKTTKVPLRRGPRLSRPVLTNPSVPTAEESLCAVKLCSTIFYLTLTCSLTCSYIKLSGILMPCMAHNAGDFGGTALLFRGSEGSSTGNCSVNDNLKRQLTGGLPVLV